MKDVWKPIKGFEGYMINERTGEILARKILKPGTHKSGAKFVILARNGERHHEYLHKLYEETFGSTPKKLFGKD